MTTALVVVGALIWGAVSIPVAVVLGRAIRLADQGGPKPPAGRPQPLPRRVTHRGRS